MMRELYAEAVTDDTWAAEVPDGRTWTIRGIEVHDVPIVNSQYHVEYQRITGGDWWPFGYASTGDTCPAGSLGRYAFVPRSRIAAYDLLSGFTTRLGQGQLPNVRLQFKDRIYIVRSHGGVPPVGAMSIYISIEEEMDNA